VEAVVVIDRFLRKPHPVARLARRSLIQVREDGYLTVILAEGKQIVVDYDPVTGERTSTADHNVKVMLKCLRASAGTPSRRQTRAQLDRMWL
jgi:hypothetical protein